MGSKDSCTFSDGASNQGIQDYVRSLSPDERKAVASLILMKDVLRLDWPGMLKMYEVNGDSRQALFTSMEDARQGDIRCITRLQELETQYGNLNKYFFNGH